MLVSTHDALNAGTPCGTQLVSATTPKPKNELLIHLSLCLFQSVVVAFLFVIIVSHIYPNADWSRHYPSIDHIDSRNVPASTIIVVTRQYLTCTGYCRWVETDRPLACLPLWLPSLQQLSPIYKGASPSSKLHHRTTTTTSATTSCLLHHQSSSITLQGFTGLLQSLFAVDPPPYTLRSRSQSLGQFQ